jgi:hypothetical protein
LQPALGQHAGVQLLPGHRRQAAELAGGHLGVLDADGVVHIGQREAVLREPVRVHPNAHGVLGAEQQHIAHAVDAADRLDDVRGDEVTDVGYVHAAVFGHQRQHHQVGLADLVDLHALLLHLRRQQRHGQRQFVLYLHLGDVGVGAGLERQRDLRIAGRVALRAHVQQAVKADHLLLDDLRDGTVDRAGRGAGVEGANLNPRWRDRRVAFDRQRGDGQATGQHDDDGDDPGEDGAVDEEINHGRRPGRRVTGRLVSAVRRPARARPACPASGAAGHAPPRGRRR